MNSALETSSIRRETIVVPKIKSMMGYASLCQKQCGFACLHYLVLLIDDFLVKGKDTSARTARYR